MTPREEIQNKIVEFLEEESSKFNAPYGVITGFAKFGKGKCRSITFGIARTLDAEIRIYAVDNITINGQGPACWKYVGAYKSVEEVLQVLKEGKPNEE